MKKFIIIYALFLMLFAGDSTYFGNISVTSDTTIVNNEFKEFLHNYRNIEFNEKNYDAFTNIIMQIPANEGYLFPLITLEKIYPATTKDSLFINPQFNLSWGNQVIIDTLFFDNIQKTSTKLLLHDLAFLKGEKYNQQTNNYIKQNLQKYSFLLFENSEIVKSRKGNYGLLIHLMEKQANKFSGIAGYVPKTASSDGYFTGQIDIDLKNINGMGRGVNIFWSKVNENSQELKLNYFEPHLLKSKIFSNLGFTQTLRDTLVVIRNVNFGFGKNISNKGIMELTGNYETTSPTPAGTELLGLEKTKIFKTGLKYSFDNRDLDSNPSKGLYINTHNYLGYHEHLNQQKIITQTDFYFETNHSLSPKLVLHLKANYQGKFIKNGKINYSDQLWFGGANSLRGYAEDFFSGSEVGILGGELRWITGYYSRIYIFLDQGYYKTLDNNINYPFSFGIGMRLESRMGTIGLDYAFGEDDTFTTAKIHIHLENRF